MIKNNGMWKLSKYVLIFRYDDCALLLSTKTGEILLFNNNYNLINKCLQKIDIRGVCDDEKIQSLFKEKSIIVENNVNELHQVMDRFNERKGSYEKFVIEIAPTLQCNFRCSYCFQKKGNTLVNKRIQKLIKKLFMTELKKCKEVNVSWFGGEPLLATQVIDSLSKFFINECGKNNVSYSAELISNGYLLNSELLDKCKKWNISKMQLTFDGLPQTIAKRKNISLEESRLYLSRLISLIPSIISKEIFITIRINIDYKNIDNIFFMPKILNELSIVHPNINFQLKSIKMPIGNKCTMECSIPRKEFIDIDIKFKRYIKSLGFTIHDNYLPRSHYCGATDINSFAIDPQGYIYKCSMFLGDSSKAILHITDLIEELKQTKPNQEKLMAFDTNPDFTNCYSCIFLPLCYGGCLMKKKNTTECQDIWQYRLKDRLELLQSE